jgi:membrane protein YdbS with pleckstrin-like domain
MTRQTPRELADARARQRFIVMNVARFGGVAMVMLGIAIIQQVIDLPFAIGVVLAVIGFVDFFVLPVVLARAWKSQDASAKDEPKA